MNLVAKFRTIPARHPEMLPVNCVTNTLSLVSIVGLVLSKQTIAFQSGMVCLYREAIALARVGLPMEGIRKVRFSWLKALTPT